MVAAATWLAVEATCCIFANEHEKTRIVTSSVVSLVCFYMLWDGPKHFPVGWVTTMISMSIAFRYTRRGVMERLPGTRGVLLGCFAANIAAATIFLLGTYLDSLV